ncbi:SAM-dependent methyltransferase [Streptomyces agglomeratus]|uniref:SAM-dependent methyltransferase n=1 Tax=Streptomyces agglomeratus TaxID=285458 RepID=UPI000AC99852|nr:SAM-dependent methyltransferase [Streptomyces agglomeratus]
MTSKTREGSVIDDLNSPERARVPAMSSLETGFPAALLSKIAESESWRKEVHRPATSTHKWWAKRLGSIFRGMLVSAVSENSAEAMRLYGTSARLDGLTVFDPFAGSGVTLVEAVKLGATAVGSDINPVATLVQRQAVQRWDLSELKRAYKMVEERCREEIDRVHRSASGESVLYYFWVAVAECPQCSVDTRLFSTHVFSKNAYPKRVPEAQLVCPECLDVVPGKYDFDRATCRQGHSFGSEGAVSRSVMTCPVGHVSKVLDALDGHGLRYEMYAKMVLGADRKKRYEPIDDFDRLLHDECTQLLAQNQADLLLPEGGLEPGENTSQAIRWGFKRWSQFFNARQLYSLGLLGSAIRSLEVGQAEKEALAALFSGTLEFNNLFCSFKGEGTGAVRHMFSNHVLKPERTPLEAHPWGTPASSGSFSTLFQSRILRAHDYKNDPADQVLDSGGKVQRAFGLSLPTERQVVESWPMEGMGQEQVYIRNGDSSRTDLPDSSVDLVITDPPYMDNVHYSELADFFHSWLRGMRVFPGYPCGASSTRNSAEVQSASPAEFGAAITAVWAECARVMKPGALLAFTFHQARISGWVSLVSALADAGLAVTSVQPVKGEMSTSITKAGKEPSNLDSIVVCRKRSDLSASVAPSPDEAADLGFQRLESLRAAGVLVGVGDVRSVVRGQVLATYTRDPQSIDLSHLSSLADCLAGSVVERFNASA